MRSVLLLVLWAGVLVGLGVALYERYWNKDTAEATYWLCSVIFNAVMATAIENEDR